MGDVGDYWREHKEYAEGRRAKRESNCENSMRILKEHGVEYGVFNEENWPGIHVVVRHGKNLVDYWPSTGLWTPRSTKKDSRGIFKLLKYLGKEVQRGSTKNNQRNNRRENTVANAPVSDGAN